MNVRCRASRHSGSGERQARMSRQRQCEYVNVREVLGNAVRFTPEDRRARSYVLAAPPARQRR